MSSFRDRQRAELLNLPDVLATRNAKNGPVELIVFFVGACVFALLAMRFGADSRSPPPSKEQDLAELGADSLAVHH
jgi:hypothetical protein